MTKQINNHSLISSTDQLTLTLRMTTTQVVETSVPVNNSPIQDYFHPDDHTQPTYDKSLCGVNPVEKLSSTWFSFHTTEINRFKGSSHTVCGCSRVLSS